MVKRIEPNIFKLRSIPSTSSYNTSSTSSYNTSSTSSYNTSSTSSYNTSSTSSFGLHSNIGLVKRLELRNNYTPNLKIVDLDVLSSLDYSKDKHRVPVGVLDGVAYGIVRVLRYVADVYFKKDYLRRVVVIETVAAIPGMVGGLFHHLYSLRNFAENGRLIRSLLSEAENERMHLMTFLEIMKPRILDRVIVRVVQYVFFNFYLGFYFFLPKTAHRFVGYLEEEAIRSYDSFEQEILKKNIKNVKAPGIALEYWKLPEQARLLDVVRQVRADEAQHRDFNHELADKKPFSFEDDIQ